jgi:hypothetical protein
LVAGVAAIGEKVPLGRRAHEHRRQPKVVGDDCGKRRAAGVDRGDGVGVLHRRGGRFDKNTQFGGSTEDALDVGHPEAWVAVSVQCLDVAVAAPQDVGHGWAGLQGDGGAASLVR